MFYKKKYIHHSLAEIGKMSHSLIIFSAVKKSYLLIKVYNLKICVVFQNHIQSFNLKPRITLFLASRISSHILFDYLLAKSRERSWLTVDGEGQMTGTQGFTSDRTTSFLFDIFFNLTVFSPQMRVLFCALRPSIQRNLTLCSEGISTSFS